MNPMANTMVHAGRRRIDSRGGVQACWPVVCTPRAGVSR